jgi:hypothetical protein
LTSEQRASRDRFFSVHASRRIVGSAVQLRNHFATLGNVNGGAGVSDLTYGRPTSPSVMQWYARLSNASSFGTWNTWSDDAGEAGDMFFTADVNADGRADLVYGRILSSTQVAWYVRLSNGAGFNDFTVWKTDAGDAGDIFRLGDVNADGRADLVYGRPLSSTTVRWYVRLSTGTSFGSYSTWVSDGGDIGDIFFLADVDADDDDDLVYARAISSTQVQWWVRKSIRFAFGDAQKWRDDAGDVGDLFYVGDLGGDGDADLLYGRVINDGQVTWYVRGSNGSGFGSVSTWANDAGDAGDLFRIGDATGDDRVDLFYGRSLGMTSLTSTPNLGWVRWYGRASLGNTFAAFTTWASDAGDEGDYFP